MLRRPIFLVWSLLASVAGGAGPAGATAVQPTLARLLADRTALPRTSSVSAHPAVLSDGRVHVLLHPSLDDVRAAAGDRGPCEQLVRRLLSELPGIVVVSARPEAVEVLLPLEQVERLATLPEIGYVGLSVPPVPLAQTQALAEMRVPDFAVLGSRGRGVRVGIIDVGFAGFQERLGTELPPTVTTRSFFNGADGNGDLTGRGEVHGTACAEVIHDVAPEASLYLANVASVGDLGRAIEWMAREGVEVISHSLAWFYGAGDGEGPVGDVVELAAAEGMLFVSAAGNFQRSHWSDLFADSDADGLVEVDEEGVESIGLPFIDTGETVSLVLAWDRWPSSVSLDFEIELRDAGDRLLRTSEDDFAGYPYAVRQVTWTSPDDAVQPRAYVRHQRGTATGVTLRVLRVDGGGQPLGDHRVPAGSLAIPADSPHALAVGAYDWTANSEDERLSVFSSFGPTLDGRPKPELLGASGVESSVYAPGTSTGFTGTSAACPHIAGAAALVLSASIRGGLFDTRWSLDEVRALLEDAALPLGAVDAEGAEGWGRARLPLARLSPARAAHAPTLRLDLWGPSGPRLVLDTRGVGRTGDETSVSVVDAAGRIRATLPPSTLPEVPETSTAFPLSSASISALARGRYWAIERSTGARTAFFWPGRAPS